MDDTKATEPIPNVSSTNIASSASTVQNTLEPELNLRPAESHDDHSQADKDDFAEDRTTCILNLQPVSAAAADDPMATLPVPSAPAQDSSVHQVDDGLERSSEDTVGGPGPTADAEEPVTLQESALDSQTPPTYDDIKDPLMQIDKDGSPHDDPNPQPSFHETSHDQDPTQPEELQSKEQEHPSMSDPSVRMTNFIGSFVEGAVSEDRNLSPERETSGTFVPRVEVEQKKTIDTQSDIPSTLTHDIFNSTEAQPLLETNALKSEEDKPVGSEASPVPTKSAIVDQQVHLAEKSEVPLDTRETDNAAITEQPIPTLDGQTAVSKTENPDLGSQHDQELAEQPVSIGLNAEVTKKSDDLPSEEHHIPPTSSIESVNTASSANTVEFTGIKNEDDAAINPRYNEEMSVKHQQVHHDPVNQALDPLILTNGGNSSAVNEDTSSDSDAQRNNQEFQSTTSPTQDESSESRLTLTDTPAAEEASAEIPDPSLSNQPAIPLSVDNTLGLPVKTKDNEEDISHPMESSVLKDESPAETNVERVETNTGMVLPVNADIVEATIPDETQENEEQVPIPVTASPAHEEPETTTELNGNIAEPVSASSLQDAVTQITGEKHEPIPILEENLRANPDKKIQREITENSLDIGHAGNLGPSHITDSVDSVVPNSSETPEVVKPLQPGTNSTESLRVDSSDIGDENSHQIHLATPKAQPVLTLTSPSIISLSSHQPIAPDTPRSELSDVTSSFNSPSTISLASHIPVAPQTPRYDPEDPTPFVALPETDNSLEDIAGVSISSSLEPDVPSSSPPDPEYHVPKTSEQVIIKFPVGHDFHEATGAPLNGSHHQQNLTQNSSKETLRETHGSGSELSKVSVAEVQGDIQDAPTRNGDFLSSNSPKAEDENKDRIAEQSYSRRRHLSTASRLSTWSSSHRVPGGWVHSPSPPPQGRESFENATGIFSSPPPYSPALSQENGKTPTSTEEEKCVIM